jgi:putative transposase
MMVHGTLKHVVLSLGLEHRLHSSYEKSLLERVVECLKDRTEGLDDYYPCRKEECELQHVYKWRVICFHV